MSFYVVTAFPAAAKAADAAFAQDPVEVYGARLLTALLNAGQYFGEMALLSNDPRNATVRAAVRTRLAVLGKENFLTLLNVLPSTPEQILKTVQDRSAQRWGVDPNSTITLRS